MKSKQVGRWELVAAAAPIAPGIGKSSNDTRKRVPEDTNRKGKVQMSRRDGHWTKDRSLLPLDQVIPTIPDTADKILIK